MPPLDTIPLQSRPIPDAPTPTASFGGGAAHSGLLGRIGNVLGKIAPYVAGGAIGAVTGDPELAALVPGTRGHQKLLEAMQYQKNQEDAKLALTNAEAEHNKAEAQLETAQAGEVGKPKPVAEKPTMLETLEQKQAFIDHVKGMGLPISDADEKEFLFGIKPVPPKPTPEPKPPPTKTIMQAGKPMIMEWNKDTQKYDIPVGPAPISAGYPRVAPVNDAQGNTIGYNYFRALPNGEVNVEFVKPTAGGAPLPGGVIPPKPTGTILTQSQRANMIEPQVNAITTAVDKAADDIGPLAGRWQEVMTGKVGANNPDVAQLMLKLELFSTALMQAHGLRGEMYEQILMNYFRLAQSPENLKARLKGANDFLQDYIGATGHGGTASTEQHTAKPPKGSMTITLPSGKKVTIE